MNIKNEEKSSLELWAEKEVELACKREMQNVEDNEWDYGCACYQSALKAFKSLCKDRHSGMSIALTTDILNRLIDGKCLTPIVDTDDIWSDGWASSRDGVKIRQCKRMSSLFKDIHPDGSVAYNDVDRVVCYNVREPGMSYHSSLGSRIVNELFPITMPYIPASQPYEVYCEEFLTDSAKHEDFDTVGILYLLKPDGTRVEVGRYFKDGGRSLSFEEIDAKEYTERFKMAIEKGRGL